MPKNDGRGSWPNVVVIGGGTGLSVMLRGLKKKQLNITAIVTVADDGGSSGVLRSELDIPPPGDIRQVLIALADVEPMLSRMLQYRFQNGSGLAGHSLGNLILAAMTDITGDFVTGIKELSRVLAVRGQVLPAAAKAIVLKAEMEDGTIVVGESRIPTVKKKIKRVYLDQAETIQPLDEAIEAIRHADAIVIGPGSLYTSILPSLLVPNISQEIMNSNVVKIYVCNVMTQPGETDGFSAHDHLTVIEQHVGGKLFEHVIVNDGVIPEPVRMKYAEQGAYPVEVDVDRMQQEGYKVIVDHLVLHRKYLRHNARKLAEHIDQLVHRTSRSSNE